MNLLKMERFTNMDQVLNLCPCGEPVGGRFTNYCSQPCFRYFSQGGIIHDLPSEGEIAYNSDGKVICHICGRAYNSLGTHIQCYHKITAKEYRIQFGLDVSARLSSVDLIELRRFHIASHPYIISGLIESGKETRFKLGSEGRTKDKMSLQTIKRLKRWN